MLRIRRTYRLEKPLNRSSNSHPKRWPQPFSKQKLFRAARVMGPTLAALAFAGVAHAQGTMDFSGAQTLMTTFNSRFAYVALSRASYDAQVFTNDASALTKNLGRDVTKTSAIDLVVAQEAFAIST
jgi:hypothetical protein